MVKANFSLEGKIALITGGSRGIGRATALGFADAGADVVVVSRKLPDLEEVANEIRRKGRKAMAIAAHVGRFDEIANLVGQINQEFGRIDILVNNAGTTPALSPLLNLEERLWDAVMNLNLKGLVFLSKAVANLMRNGGGSIINVASVAGFRHEVNACVYAISKAGVIMATRVMAQEWAPLNIRANAIAPGHIHTRLGDSIFSVVPGYKEEYIRRVPMGRIGEPEDVVGAMIYLASDASSYVTGTTLIVDGGALVS